MIASNYLIPGETFLFPDKSEISQVSLSDYEINEKYKKGEIRIVTEQARYPLDSIETMLDSQKYILNPEYQRRKRWNNTRKSRLIESFIMNVPIPPIFLYEVNYSIYEVMDGLQRLTAIYDFYKGKYNLEGLEYWRELNGRNYQNLPEQVKRGIDRRYLSSIVLLQETAKSEEEADFLKQIVFERLNSGGEKLTPQQTRADFDEQQVKFMNEAVRLAQCSHPHIVKVHEVIKEDELWGMVMEHIDGQDLAAYIDERGRLPEDEALRYINQVGEALEYVHAKGFLHRDIKPNNILLRRGTKEAVLIDFGLAREFNLGKVGSMTNAKTEGYAPIEQYERRGNFGAYTDVYALAGTLYSLLTAEVPFPANFRKSGIPLPEPKQFNSQISDRVNQAILKGMVLEPEGRTATVKEWLELINPKPQTDYLESSVGMDYTRLRDLLKAGEWKQADEETTRVMLAVAGREKEGWLDVKQIDNFPCEDFRTIDQLWVKYSNGRFGFSVQKRIYHSLGGTRQYDEKIWEAYGDRVGWRKGGLWLYYKDNTFNLTAPQGYLPCTSLWNLACGEFFLYVYLFSSLASRLVKFNI